MKISRSAKRLLCLALAAFFAVQCAAVAFCAQENTYPQSDGFIRSVYYSSAVYKGQGDTADYSVYSDSLFTGSAFENNIRRAVAGAVLSVTTSGSVRGTAESGYSGKSRSVTEYLSDIGFSDIQVNEDYTVKPTVDTCAAACARKTVFDGGEPYTLLVIALRTGDYEAEWGSNFTLGEEGDAAGFLSGALRVLSFVREYISAHSIEGNIKVWTVGYSRAAAVCNLLAARLADAPEEYIGDGVSLSSDDLYACTYACPAGADISNDPHDERYACIHNYYCTDDVVPRVAPYTMGFERYGVDHPVNDEALAERMREIMFITNPALGEDMFENGVSGADFSPKRFLLDEDKMTIVDDPNSRIPSDVNEYLDGLSQWMTIACGGRKNYAEVYELPLRTLIAYYTSLTGSRKNAFTNAVTSHDDFSMAFVSLYAYFLRSRKSYLYGSKSSAAPAQSNTDIAAVGAGSTGDLPFSFSITDLWGVINTLMVETDADEVRNQAAGYVKAILSDAFDASSADESVRQIVLSDDSAYALSHVLSYLMFGNIWQRKNTSALILTNDQLSNLATMISNIDKITVNHYPEVLISWLRAGDPDYDDYTALTEAQKSGYRRVYIGSSSDYSGSVISNGRRIASISGGAITDCDDPWICSTACDSGSYLRIPSDCVCRLNLSFDSASQVTVRIAEYSYADGIETYIRSETLDIGDGGKVIVKMSSVPSDKNVRTFYDIIAQDSSFITGDADRDGEVSIIDATVIQRWLADLISDDAIDLSAADANLSGDVSILDATAIQRALAGYSVL